MSLPTLLGPAKTLGYFVDHLDELRSCGWLYVRAGEREVSLATECYPVVVDSRDVSEDEIVALEANATAAGFKEFLCNDQLRDIATNLQEQRPEFTRTDLERAIDFYWRRDAFIVLDCDEGMK